MHGRDARAARRQSAPIPYDKDQSPHRARAGWQTKRNLNEADPGL